jgi:hypothetical protein
MDADQYSEFVYRAHSSYIKGRLYGQKESHISDLAVETASFFEAMYHILDAYGDVTRTPNFKIQVRQDSEIKAYWDEVMEKVKQEANKERKGKNEIKKETKKGKKTSPPNAVV